MRIKYSVELPEGSVKKLRRLSKQTKVPQYKLLEEAVWLLKAHYEHILPKQPVE